MNNPFLRIRYSLALIAAFVCSVGQGAPFFGTTRLDPDIITENDPTTFLGLSYVGQGQRLVFDRRVGWGQVNMYLFHAGFGDGLDAEIRVNPEFGSIALAQESATLYAVHVGRLPTALREDVATITIHQGDNAFGGGNNNLLIHSDRGSRHLSDGFLEETFIHEAAHASLDDDHANSPGWLAAQLADPDFISTNAANNPTREDVAASFLTWLAVRYRSDRISATLTNTIESTIPNRLAYFDRQGFNMFPIQSVPEPSCAILCLVGTCHVLLARRRRTRHA